MVYVLLGPFGVRVMIAPQNYSSSPLIWGRLLAPEIVTAGHPHTEDPMGAYFGELPTLHACNIPPVWQHPNSLAFLGSSSTPKPRPFQSVWG